MWSVGSSSSPPMMSNYTGNGNYNGSSVYLGNGLSTAAKKSSTMPHSPPWDVGTTSRSNATMRYTDRWNSMHRNEMMAMRSSTRRQWSWGSLVYGMFVCGCCNVGGLFFGSIATVIAMLQYTDHKSADYSRAARKRRISLCLSSVGLILGLMTLAVLLLLYFFLPSVHIAVNDIFSSIQTSVRQRNITSSGQGNSSSNAKTSTWLHRYALGVVILLDIFNHRAVKEYIIKWRAYLSEDWWEILLCD